MDLDFPTARTNGRAERPLAATIERELTAADLALLATERGIKPTEIKKYRDSHHALARALASGMHANEAALFTGYSVSRIYILQMLQSFQDLVAFYRAAKNEVYADLHARMATLSLEAEAELRERLHDTPEQFTPEMLLEIVKTLADRTGHGPSSKSTVLNLNVDLAGRLERARARAGVGRVTEVIDHRPGPEERGFGHRHQHDEEG